MKKEYDFSKGRRGPVLKVPPGKTRVTIRLDDDILDWFRQQVDATRAAETTKPSSMRLSAVLCARSRNLERQLSGA